MLASNVDAVLKLMKPSDTVLDVGGWACPFNRADWILDAEPYETRGFYGKWGMPASQGGDQERFTHDTWVRRDICDRRPWPFSDKQFDFVICSHTLEDIRDPLGVCAEMIRVGKAGYIEVPSREWESCRGMESATTVGLSHHRWLVEIAANHIQFTPKYHIIHSHWRLSFPPSHSHRIPADKAVTFLWWQGDFSYSETSLHGTPAISEELSAFVQSVRPYPVWRLASDRAVRHGTSLCSRVVGKIRRVLSKKPNARSK